MNFVGKLLVVGVTVCSVLFMGFAVTVYATRENWRAEFNKQKVKLDDATKKQQALQQVVNTLSADITREVENHKKERLGYEQQIKVQQTNHVELLKNWEQARADAAKYAEQAKLYGDQAAARTKEAKQLDEQLTKTREQKDDAQKKEFDARQALIILQGSHETLQARAKELEQRAGQLQGILEKYGMSPRPEDHGQLATVPPTVEGVILEVDPQGKFVKISVGSDDGVRKQHRLQVYRVKPQGKFVATIEITEVDPDHAVARIIPQLKQANIQEGDLVATRITASR